MHILNFTQLLKKLSAFYENQTVTTDKQFDGSSPESDAVHTFIFYLFENSF
jgi:hypothetical protein